MVGGEIAVLCELKSHLTHHLARNTFATTVLLLNDIPMKVVSKLLGHSRMAITHGHITEEKVIKEIDKLTSKI